MGGFDYIIVGAGSAGCVLADRLSGKGQARVLILEAGGADNSFWIRTPIGYGRTFFDPRVNWMYRTLPDPQTGGRESYWPRGKVIGGSSSINALVWCRGMPTDFQDWVAAGAAGWTWAAVRDTYEALESRVLADGRIEGDGPLFVSDVRREIHPTNRHFFAMAAEMGLAVTEDCNGAEPEGITTWRITTRHGRRWSSADAFLKPALRRGGVTLIKNCHVDRIVIENGRAVGVTVRGRDGLQRFDAAREVIVSAGAVGSPKLLQLSGIGPAALLSGLGIRPVVANDNVGANLQDHLAVNYYFKATEPTMNSMLSPWWGKAIQGARYLLTRRGPLSLSVNQCGGFLRSQAGLDRPDQQIYLAPVTHTTAPSNKRPIINPDPFAGFILSFQPARPTSRGRIEIASADPDAAPRIIPNYLATEEDRANVVAGGRLVQRMAQSAALRRFTLAAIAPDLTAMDDAAILEDFRQRCSTVFHPVATCRMAADAADGVTDSALRVFGVKSLRVVDASAFPNITSGNTNAPTIMLAHRAADLILADAAGTAHRQSRETEIAG